MNGNRKQNWRISFDIQTPMGEDEIVAGTVLATYKGAMKHMQIAANALEAAGVAVIGYEVEVIS